MDKELIRRAIVATVQKYSVEKPEYNLAVIDDESVEFFGHVFGYIEAEVLKGYEQVGEIIMYVPYGQLCAPFARPEWIGGSLPPVGTKLYTAPQPPAPCQCAELRAEVERLTQKNAELREKLHDESAQHVQFMLHERVANQSALIEK